MRDEKLEREYPEIRSDFYLDVYDKRLVNLFDISKKDQNLDQLKF